MCFRPRVLRSLTVVHIARGFVVWTLDMQCVLFYGRDTLHVEYTLSLYVAGGQGFFSTHIVAGDVTAQTLMLILWGMY
jgi:hypothetical protein